MTSLILTLSLSLAPAQAAGACEGGSPDIKGWTVTREATVQAPAETVWAMAADYNTWPDWTNWGKERDPEAQWTFEGDAGAVGHAMSWDGPKLKTGGMTVTAAEGMCMEYDLMFGKAKKANAGYIVVSEAGEGTSKVTWHSAGHMGGLSRMLFAGAAEKAIGADFDAGLMKLDVHARKAYAAELGAQAEAAKATAEASAAAAVSAGTAAAEAKAALEAAKAELDAAQAAMDAARYKSAKKKAQPALDAATEKHAAAEAEAKAADEAAAAAEAQAKADAEAAEALAAKVAGLAKGG